MSHSTTAALLYLFATGLGSTAAAQVSPSHPVTATTPPGPCAGKAPGKYCAGNMIMTCVAGSSEATAVGCGIARTADGKELIGRCVSKGPNDNKAVCR